MGGINLEDIAKPKCVYILDRLREEMGIPVWRDDQRLAATYILPRMDEWEVFPRQAVAVGMKAIEQGVARITMDREELFARASRIITRAREETRALMAAGLIAV